MKSKSVTLDTYRLFNTLDTDRDGRVSRELLLACVRTSGLLESDPRLQGFLTEIGKPDGPAQFDVEAFGRLIEHAGPVMARALEHRLIIPDFDVLRAELHEIFELTAKNNSGKVADYIPELSRINPDLFAVSACTIDGQRVDFGDSEQSFCVQSVMKPINYAICLEENGETETHRYLGREPSGRGFNELTLNKEGRPHNPLINAGAIVGCSMIRPNENSAERFDLVLQTWKKLAAGETIGFNNAVFLSERQTADRNFALGYFMREKGCFPPESDMLQALEFYFQCCSIELNTRGLAAVAAALASGGRCAVTGQRVLGARTVQNMLSLMSSCGMYDFSGEFAFSIGLPAKSGVSGALMVVVPEVMGLAIYSPRLDAIGNSVRGIEFCRELVARTHFHVFDNILQSTEDLKREPRVWRKPGKS